VKELEFHVEPIVLGLLPGEDFLGLGYVSRGTPEGFSFKGILVEELGFHAEPIFSGLWSILDEYFSGLGHVSRGTPDGF
jgi:hypothetical protein